MGVSSLWDVLAPVGRPCEINTLETKCVAVDLSGWVCDSCSVTAMKAVVINPHLRNLYYRASCLKLSGIDVIFVIEGKAPKLKSSTIQNRCMRTTNNILHANKEGNIQRGNFQIKLRECQKLLEILGIQCVQASGEGEAMCAYLNEQLIVDGCISNDSDAFLYGAKKVYRNFTMEKKVAKAVCYSMSDIKTKLGLDREMLVALALLLGCDYTQGVPGIGKKKALEFVKKFSSGKEILKIFQEWRDKPDFVGSALQDYKDIELIKNQAKKVIGFPSQEVIQEFLVSKEKKPAAILQWAEPNLSMLNDFCKRKLDWPHEATEKSSVQISTRWQLEETIKNGHSENFPFQVSRIVKLQKRMGNSYVKIEWTRNDKLEPFITSEPLHLIKAALPQHYSIFNQALPGQRMKTKKKPVEKERFLQKKIVDCKQVASTSKSTEKSCNIIKNRDSGHTSDKKPDVIVIDDSSSDDEFDKMLQALKKFSVAVDSDLEQTTSCKENVMPDSHPSIPETSKNNTEKTGQCMLPDPPVHCIPMCLADRVKRQLNGNADLEAILNNLTGSKF